MAGFDTNSFQRYQQILFWPLEILASPAPAAGAKDVACTALPLHEHAKQIPKPWERLSDKLTRGTADDPQTPYQEFVYFHPFAQKFLYEDDSFCLFHRQDIGRVSVKLDACAPAEETLDVLRVHLYLFHTQVAILVVEVAAAREISRESVLLLEDRFRRIYPPYWFEDNSVIGGGHCPGQVEWLDRHGAPIPGAPKSDYGNRDTLLGHTQSLRTPPICSHWKWLIEGIGHPSHLEDDRAPSMVFLQHPDPLALSESDLVRHCFFDGPGAVNAYPYSPVFLNNFKENYCYLRYWNDDGSPGNWMNTLYMCSGYSFTALVGPYSSFLLEHFRNHYFQLGLLAHFHRATLLRFSRRFNAVSHVGSEQSWKDLRIVHAEFATFLSASWFHEVSNQEQGRELFDFWSRHLRSKELLENIMTEAKAVNDILASHSQLRLAERVDRLTILLFLAAFVTIIVASLDMGIVSDTLRAVEKPEESPWFWPWTIFWASLFGLIGFVVYRLVVRAKDSTRKLLRPALFALLVVICLISLAAALRHNFRIQQMLHF